MSLVYLGSLSVGSAVPSVDASIGITLPQLQAQIDGLVAAAAFLNANPPTIAASLTLAQSIVTSITADIALGVQVPSLSLQLAAIASFLAVLNTQVTLLASFESALGAAGVHAYAYAGPANGLGPAIPASFPGGAPTDPINALLLVTAIPATWTAMSVILKTS